MALAGEELDPCGVAATPSKTVPQLYAAGCQPLNARVRASFAPDIRRFNRSVHQTSNISFFGRMAGHCFLAPLTASV
jgi:hypothetical protein